jgi:hypothetical protein
MTTWIRDYLEKNVDMGRRAVLLRAETATHFALAPGLARAVITGAPQYFRAGRAWRAFDLTLREDASGKLGADGVAIRVGRDGLVSVVGKDYWQHSLSVGTLTAGRYSKLADLPRGRPEGGRLVRETGIFRHELILIERGVEEQLVVLERPLNLAGEYFVYETAVPLGVFPLGALRGEWVAAGLHFPAGRAVDAVGRIFPLERFVVGSGESPRVYTGLPLSVMESAAYPLVLDPTINLSGATADGEARGQASAYATARSTSTSLDTSSADFGVGQAYESAIPRYYVYRGFLKFDLASISPQAEILSATMGLVCVSDASTLADFDIQIVKQSWSGQDPLTDANREAAYDNCLAGAEDAVWRNTSAIATGTQYISPPLDASYLTPGGLAYYGLRGSRDKNNTPPASNGNEYIRIASANHSTPTFRLVLIVDYASVFPAAARATMPSPAISIVDMRIKLRARPRDAALTTIVRKEA